MRLLVVLIFLPVLAWAQSHLLISEIYIPASADQQKAFIEIYNPGDQTVPLDSIYLSNYNQYYEVVTATFSNTTSDFLVQFPAGAVIAPHGTRTVALYGAAFRSAYGKNADYEISGDDDNTSDMVVHYAGGNITLDPSAGMAILFYWNGANDLVYDEDYLAWGLSFFKDRWMDKSGVSMDGPDADSTPSVYQNETAKSSQKALASPTTGNSYQRSNAEEPGETTSGGNGISGHDETSEDWAQTFALSTPSPGSFSEVPGDGSGTATVTPDTVDAATAVTLTFTLTGTAPYTLESAAIVIPESWTFSGSSADVSLSAPSGELVVSADTIHINNTALSDNAGAEITIAGLTAPDASETTSFPVLTAVGGGRLTPIASFPSVFVFKPTTIADIQNNVGEWLGREVTVQGVVSIGSGVTTTSWTDAYVQDESGRGINVFRSPDLTPDLKRGNKVTITGTVDTYNGTTEITNFGVTVEGSGFDVPAVSQVSLATAADTSLEGTMVEVSGVITDIFNVGGGDNVTLTNGANSLVARVWESSGVDLSPYALGDTVAMRGVIDIYNGSAQLLVAYDDDIRFSDLYVPVDGSGNVTVSPAQVEKNASTDLLFTFTPSDAGPLVQARVDIPDDWGFSASADDVTTGGDFSDASISINGNTILLSDFSLESGFEGTLTLKNLTAPNSDKVSTFNAYTAGEGGLLAPVAASPIVLVGEGTTIPTIKMEEARQRGDGSSVAVKGTIVIGSGILRNDLTSAYIADENGVGLNIFRAGGADPDIARGNLVVLQGTLTLYNGVLEIENYTTTVLARHVPLPDPIRLSTAEAALTDYEGSWVTVQGIVTGKSVAGGGTNIYMDDGSGETTVRVWDTAGLNLDDIAVGDLIEVKGAHGVFRDAGQILVGYQEDISKVDIASLPVTLDVPPRPFAPDQGEQLPITYGAGGGSTHVTLRVFDMAGRLVATLRDGDGIPIAVTFKWDGRNELGDRLTPGSYILHYEVVNEETGDKTVKVAPVVVGTLLSR